MPLQCFKSRPLLKVRSQAVSLKVPDFSSTEACPKNLGATDCITLAMGLGGKCSAAYPWPGGLLAPSFARKHCLPQVEPSKAFWHGESYTVQLSALAAASPLLTDASPSFVQVLKPPTGGTAACMLEGLPAKETASCTSLKDINALTRTSNQPQ